MTEHGGMELVELHVPHRDPRPVGHGDAISSGHGGIGRARINLARSSCRQKSDGRRERHASTGPCVECVDTAASGRLIDDKVHCQVVVEYRHRRHGRQRRLQGPGDLLSREVIGMDDPCPRMTSFASQRQLSATHPGEAGPQIDELLDQGRSLCNSNLDRRRITQSRAGSQRVPHMHLGGIVAVSDRGDASLRVTRIRLPRLLLGDEGHRSVLCRLNSKIETSNTTADDQIIGLNLHIFSKINELLQKSTL